MMSTFFNTDTETAARQRACGGADADIPPIDAGHIAIMFPHLYAEIDGPAHRHASQNADRHKLASGIGIHGGRIHRIWIGRWRIQMTIWVDLHVAAELGSLCKGTSQPFRRTRPAEDPLNATINYLTYMLERDTRSAIRAVGLHTGFGFLHRPRDYSEAAVYDLMEPFRAPLTEGLAVFLLNARRLKYEMFSCTENKTMRMDNQARKAVISGYEQAVAKRINIPGQRQKLAWRRMMHYQARTLSKAYRQDNPDLFLPYVMKA